MRVTIGKNERDSWCTDMTQPTPEYMVRYRSKNAAYRKRNNARTAARDRALRELGRRYPKQLKALYEWELAQLPDELGGVSPNPSRLRFFYWDVRELGWRYAWLAQRDWKNDGRGGVS
jgi:hypothetical protein